MPWRQWSVCAFNAFHIKRWKKWTVCRYRFYPPESAKDWAGLVCPSVESQPVSLPPAAASPASFPEIHRLPSPHTRPLSETSQSKSLSLLIQRQKKIKNPANLSSSGPLRAFGCGCSGFCLQENDSTFCTPSLSRSTFCKPRNFTWKKPKKNIDLFQGSVTKGDGLCSLSAEYVFFFFWS